MEHVVDTGIKKRKGVVKAMVLLSFIIGAILLERL